MLLVLVLVSAVVGYDHSVNYWQAFAPGKLLQRLDALTSSTTGQLNTKAAELPHAQAKLDEDADTVEGTDVDVDADAAEHDHDDEDDVEADAEAEELEADSHSAEANSGEYYERNYEQFVRQYFDRAVDDDYAADDDDAVEEHVDDVSVETQAEASNLQPEKKMKKGQLKEKQKQKEKQNCRHVHRQGQLCKICREKRNNEVSETCSYSHEAQPEQYAYGSGTQYKRYRDHGDDEQTKQRRGRHTKPKQKEKQKEDQKEKENEKEKETPSSSLCERRLVGKSVCYECRDSGGQLLRGCYDAATNTQSRSTANH